MNNILSKYWYLILMVFITINFLGFYFMEESIGISDALEHAESNEMIQRFKGKDFWYSSSSSLFLVLDITIILLVGYLLIIKLLKLNKN